VPSAAIHNFDRREQTARWKASAPHV
jgi:hypothetical protein